MRYTKSENLTGSQESLNVFAGRLPVERTHGKRIVFAAVNSKLLFEVIERKERVGCIEIFVVLAVGTLHLAVMTRRIRLDQLMPDAILHKPSFKQRGRMLRCRQQSFGEFGAIIRLYARNREWKCLAQMLQKDSRAVGAMLLKRLEITESGVLVDGGILKEFLSLRFGIAHDAGSRNELHINLHTLPRIKHLFIGLRHILGIWRLDRRKLQFAQHAPEARDGTPIATLPQLHPEHDQTGVQIPFAHPSNQPDFCITMLVWMLFRTVGMVAKRLQSPIIPAFPAVDELAADIVSAGRRGNPMLLCP